MAATALTSLPAAGLRAQPHRRVQAGPPRCPAATAILWIPFNHGERMIFSLSQKDISKLQQMTQIREAVSLCRMSPF